MAALGKARNHHPHGGSDSARPTPATRVGMTIPPRLGLTATNRLLSVAPAVLFAGSSSSPLDPVAGAARGLRCPRRRRGVAAVGAPSGEGCGWSLGPLGVRERVEHGTRGVAAAGDAGRDADPSIRAT